MTPKTRPICTSQKMRMAPQLSGIPWIHNELWRPHHGRWQDLHHPRLPRAPESKRCSIFLRFANFYQRFIHNYSEITVPLTRLTQKGLTWDFSEECHTAFRTLKEAFTRAPILAHWKPDQWMVVETDASDYTLAAILLVYNTEGTLHPITFHSCTFTGPELNYNVHDKELSANFKHSNSGDIT